MHPNVRKSDLYANHYSYETQKTSLTDKNSKVVAKQTIKTKQSYVSIEKAINYQGIKMYCT